jgi:hypothetical protein
VCDEGGAEGLPLLPTNEQPASGAADVNPTPMASPVNTRPKTRTIGNIVAPPLRRTVVIAMPTPSTRPMASQAIFGHRSRVENPHTSASANSPPAVKAAAPPLFKNHGS